VKENNLTLRIQKEQNANVFCPRCGLIVPLHTKCIPSPTRPEVHYHANCMLTLAERLGRRVEWRQIPAMA
jgi:hypothetical protein